MIFQRFFFVCIIRSYLSMALSLETFYSNVVSINSHFVPGEMISVINLVFNELPALFELLLPLFLFILPLFSNIPVLRLIPHSFCLTGHGLYDLILMRGLDTDLTIFCLVIVKRIVFSGEIILCVKFDYLVQTVIVSLFIALSVVVEV